MRTRPVEIEVNNIFYCYIIRAMWISIYTAPDDKQHGKVPEDYKVTTMVETPNHIVGLNPANKEVMRIMHGIIRGEVEKKRRRVEGRV